MGEVQDYLCPCCGGNLSFDSGVQKMKCPYCLTEFEMEALRAYDEDLKGDTADKMEWQMESREEWKESETEGMRIYSCNTCGGEIIGDETLGATSCPYCGNHVVVKGQFAGGLRPDLVIPFRLDKNAAMDAYRKHIKGKRLLPKVFASQNHIDEIKGLYVPFWMFHADADANIRYKATKTRTWEDSRFRYKETSHFSVVRSGGLSFQNVPVDGSSKLADDLMESIEPFDMSGAVDFQTAYLAGYLADKYDVNETDSIARANQRIKTSTERVFADTVKDYSTVNVEASSVRLSSGKTEYVLCPVWLLNTTWNGNQYTFAMNGQTGKLVGNLPVDKAARNRWLGGITAVGTALIFALTYLVWLI